MRRRAATQEPTLASRNTMPNQLQAWRVRLDCHATQLHRHMRKDPQTSAVALHMCLTAARAAAAHTVAHCAVVLSCTLEGHIALRRAALPLSESALHYAAVRRRPGSGARGSRAVRPVQRSRQGTRAEESREHRKAGRSARVAPSARNSTLHTGAAAAAPTSQARTAMPMSNRCSATLVFGLEAGCGAYLSPGCTRLVRSSAAAR